MRTDSGFTLIEAVVALVIMAALLTVLANGAATGWRGLAAAERERRALALAENELRRAGREWPLEAGTRSGASGPLSYRHDVSPHASNLLRPRSAQRLYEVAVEVRWREGSGPDRRVTLTTLKLRGPP